MNFSTNVSLLIECIYIYQGLEMYGFGNWEEVAEHAGTKSRDQCLDHYNSAYMNSPCFPLPVRLIFTRFHLGYFALHSDKWVIW